MISKIKETVELIHSRLGDKFRHQRFMGLILGSGLGAFADSFEDRRDISFSDLPHFPSPTVPGHTGNLIAGSVHGVPLVALQGRIHLYEGFSIDEIAFPARALCSCGIYRLVVTNAAGGINAEFRPGDLMLITDHINMMGTNPLIGPNLEELGPRFPDMTEAYDSAMRNIALETAGQLKIPIRQGIYLGLPGPSYETPAEIRMFRTLGADAVGMSTIPEVIVANHMGIPVLGVSLITNMAAGILPQTLTHEEVIGTAERTGETFRSLLRAILPRLVDTQ